MPDLLAEAVQVLAKRDWDGARYRNGVGFNGQDSTFGRAMAVIPVERWQMKDRRRLYKIIQKYRGQLLDEQIRVEDIPNPNGHVMDFRDGAFRAEAPYDHHMVEHQRQITGRRWDGECWNFPLSSAPRVREFLSRWADKNWVVTDAAQEALRRTPAAAPREAVNPRQITWKEGYFSINFQGDPEFRNLLALVKRLPGRRFNGRLANYVPRTSSLEVEEFARTHGFSVSTAVRAVMEQERERGEKQKALEESLVADSVAKDADIDLDVDGLAAFQKAAVKYALDRRNVIIADEMGLGKTLAAIASVEEDAAYPCIVYCGKSVLQVWQREYRRWNPSARVAQVDTVSAIPKKVDVVLTTYEAAFKRKEELKAIPWKGLVIDEGHEIRNETKRFRGVRQVADSMPSNALKLILTGTPVVNTPDDLENQLRVLRLSGKVKSLLKVEKLRFANEHQLQLVLRALCMIRRTKVDVMPELPPRRWATDVEVPLSNLATYRRAEANFLAWYAEQGGNVEAAMRAEFLAKLTALRKLSALGKIDGALDWIREFLGVENKLILFAHHRDVQDALLESLRDYNPVAILGGTAQEDRAAAERLFQEDPSVRVIVLSIRAASQGITLTEASNVAFLEMDWTPMRMNQGLDRAHRIGQRDAVTGYRFVGPPGTVDDILAGILSEKDAMTDGVLVLGEHEEKASIGTISLELARRLAARDAVAA